MVDERPEVIFGQFGLTKVQYRGTARGRYRGPQTCHWYEVEPGRLLYVDVRDKAVLLGLKDGQEIALFVDSAGVRP